MTPDPAWLCLGCGGFVHEEFVFTHAAFHERLGSPAEFRRIGGQGE